jgi:hypothetical protein
VDRLFSSENVLRFVNAIINIVRIRLFDRQPHSLGTLGRNKIMARADAINFFFHNTPFSILFNFAEKLFDIRCRCIFGS